MSNQFKNSVYNSWVNTTDTLWAVAKKKVIASVLEAWHVAAIPKAITESYGLIEEKEIAFPTDWTDRISLIVDDSKVVATETGFQALVHVTYSDLFKKV